MTVKTKPNAQWATQRPLGRAVLAASADENGTSLPHPLSRLARSTPRRADRHRK